MKCTRTDCARDARHAVGIAVFPMPAFLKFHKTSHPLTRVVFNLPVCGQHLADIQNEGVVAIMDHDRLRGVLNLLERQSGVTLRVEDCKVVRVKLTDPDYLRLVAEKKAGTE